MRSTTPLQNEPSLGLHEVEATTPMPVLMGHGLGVESAAILTQWLTEPASLPLPPWLARLRPEAGEA